MKILWIINTVLPEAANRMGIACSASGSWLVDISNMLAEEKDISLIVASVHGNKFQSFQLNNGIKYYLLPGTGKNMLFYCKKYEELWEKVQEEVRPDIVHIHGTEYSHGLAYLRACPTTKAIISIQGILSRIKDVDFGEISPWQFMFKRTIMQNIHFNGEIELHFLHKKNANHEQEMLKRVKYINAVNTWDKSICLSINPDLKVFIQDYNLREEMYQSRKWSIETIDRHTVFTNPGGTPLKGLHQLIRAVALLRDKYPNIKVHVPGMGKNGVLEIKSAYAKYISKLIKKYNLENNINFVGQLDAQQICNAIIQSHITVIPSAIEGTSLILREAMFLGCPCIASFRGGMGDFISDKQDGFLYDYQEYPYLAARIDELFSDDKLCSKLSSNALLKASKAHNRDKNLSSYLKMYHSIISD